MDLEALIAALSRPAAYPHDVQGIRVVQTHLSVVFLTGRRAYKVLKPVALGFVDWTDDAVREQATRREVEVNAAYSPEVYRGVVAVDIDGRVDGPGPVWTWAIVMEQLDAADTLSAQLRAGRLSPSTLHQVGAHIARLHQRAPRPADTGMCPLARLVRESFEETRSHVGAVVTQDAWEATRAAFEQRLEALSGAIDRGHRDAVLGHGDLRLEHVYAGPNSIRLLDAVGFNDSFRAFDPLLDLAFLTMDLSVRGHQGLADAVLEGWQSERSQPFDPELYAVYVAYRSLVRAKVRGLQALEARAKGQRGRADHCARRHWLYALATLAPPLARPQIVAVGGLPGTGKSTLSERLVGRLCDAEWIRSDVVRRELFALQPGESAKAGYGSGLYTEALRDAVYGEVLDRAEEALAHGWPVVLDASWTQPAWRQGLVERGRMLGVPVTFVRCHSDAALVLERLAARRGDVSDADGDTYRRAAVDADWAKVEGARHLVVDVHSGVDRAADRVVASLRGVEAGPAVMPPPPVRISP